MDNATINTIAKLTVGKQTKEINYATEPHIVIVSDEDYSISDIDFVHIAGETANLSEIEKTIMGIYTEMSEAGEIDFTKLQRYQRNIISFPNLESILELAKEEPKEKTLSNILRLGRAAGYHVAIRANNIPEGVILNSNLSVISFKQMSSITFEEAREIVRRQVEPTWNRRGQTFYVAEWGRENDQFFMVFAESREYLVDGDVEAIEDTGALHLVDKITGEYVEGTIDEFLDVWDTFIPVGKPAPRQGY